MQADGPRLSGSVKTDFFDAKIENGTIKDDKVLFIINTDFGTATYEGMVAADEIKFNVTGPDGNPIGLKAKKQK